jgi:hypothetical protein
MERQAFAILFALLVLPPVSIAVVCFGSALLQHRYPWSDMDWNEDGQTVAAEVFRSVDIGVRQVRLGGGKCLEYFDQKDGMTVRVVCPERVQSLGDVPSKLPGCGAT